MPNDFAFLAILKWRAARRRRLAVGGWYESTQVTTNGPPFLRWHGGRRRMGGVVAERLIGLEAALAELSRLYVVAKGFTPLRATADQSLLPQISSLGAELRRHLRQHSLDDAAIDTVVERVARLRQEWHAQLDGLHQGALYQRCLYAWKSAQTDELTLLLPQLLADIEPAGTPLAFFYGVSPSSGRRRPGGRPFITPIASADTIASYQRDGIPVEANGAEWWDTELRSLVVAGEPTEIDTPVALRIDPASVRAPVFAIARQPSFRIFAEVVQVRFRVILDDEVADEWWQAFDQSYEQWRAALAQELTQRGIVVE